MKYNNEEDVKTWIIKGGEGEKSKEPRSTKMVAGAWTAIYMARDSIEQLEALYGDAYKWEFRKSKPLVLPFAVDGMSRMIEVLSEEVEELKKFKEKWEKGGRDMLAIPSGYEVVLRLKRFYEKKRKEEEALDDWEDILCIRRSNRKYGGLGVFAKRRFETGNVVGLYMGKAVLTCSEVGGMEPSMEELEAELKMNPSNGIGDEQVMAIRNWEGRWSYIDAGKLEGGKEVHLFVGTHYINDALLDVYELAPQQLKKKANAGNNAHFMDDGFCMATKKILKESEIMAHYQLTRFCGEEESEENDRKPAAKVARTIL